MKKAMKFILSPLLILFGMCSFAQTSYTITIKPGDQYSVDQVAKEVYHYPTFAPGVVYFKGGGTAKGRLNYHRIYKEMVFIGGKGDTLLLNNPTAIQLITVSADSFYYHDKTYVQHVTSAGNIKLVENQILFESDRKKKGIYGEELTGPTAAFRLDLSNFSKRLSNNEEIIFKKEIRYFLGDGNRQFLQANKSNLLKLVDKSKKNAVEGYLKATPIHFEKREDLERLFIFLNTL
jgi:hypothetical protein